MSQNSWNAGYNSAKGSLLVGNGTRPIVRTVGANGQVLTANSANVDGVEWAAGGGGSIVNLSPYIVGATQSDFTTISAAIAQAVIDGASSANPFNIYIKTGTYVENIALSNGINLVGFGGREATWTSVTIGTDIGSTIISGNITVTGTYTSICNINIVPPAGNTFEITQTNGNLTLDKVNVVALINTSVFNIGGTLNNSNIQCNDCTIKCSGASGRVSNNVGITNNATFSFINCMITSTAGVASLVDNSSRTDYFYESCNVIDSISSNNCTANITVRNSVWLFLTPFGLTTGTGLGAIIAESSFVSPGLISSSNAGSQIQFRGCTTNALSYSLPAGASVNLGGWISQQGLLIRGGSGFAGSQYQSNTARIQTLNAVATTIFSLTINLNETATLKAQITGADSTHANAVGGTVMVVVNRAGGASALVGVPTVDVKSTSTATFTAALVGNNIAIRVTGVLATTYNWTCYVEHQKMLTNA